MKEELTLSMHVSFKAGTLKPVVKYKIFQGKKAKILPLTLKLLQNKISHLTGQTNNLFP